MDYFIFQNLSSVFLNTEEIKRGILEDKKGEREVVNEYIGIFGKINGFGLAY